MSSMATPKQPRASSATTPKTMTKEMEVEDDVVPQQFTEIEVLQNFGIQACDIKKLQAAGYHTVDRVCMTMPKKLADIKGLSDAKVAKIQEECRKLCPRFQFQSGLDVAAARQESLIRITTGSDDLDHILGGGIETGSITCVFGEYRTGKSQLALTMAVACQTPMEQKGANARSIVIDTEGSFRTERIVEVAERFGLPGQDVLANMQVARCYTPDQVEACLVEASAICRREEHRLIIIDSIISPFRFEYAGRGELSERQIRLGQILRLAKKLADEFNIAVLLTNQVMADPGNSMFIQDAKKAVGGHILSHNADTIVNLRKGKGEQRVAKIIDSPTQPEAEASYQITTGGIDNYADA